MPKRQNFADNRFYIYKHVSSLTGLTFYIGKGCEYRAFEKHGRNKYWRHIARKEGYRVLFISKSLDEKTAYHMERNLIALFKRKGLCRANLDSGGNGGKQASEETKNKISAMQRGRVPWNKGKKTGQQVWNKGASAKHDPRVRRSTEAMHRALSGRPPWNKGVPMAPNTKETFARNQGCRVFRAINRFTSEIAWEGLVQTACIEFLKLGSGNKGNLNSCLKGKRRHVKDYIFKYVDEVEVA